LADSLLVGGQGKLMQ
jgi:WD40 repeat protein